MQDGGVVGTISNLAFLLVMGTLVEQFLSVGQWFVCYFGAGLCGEIVAYAWQPTGAGNSVANCGLAGALIVALLASRRMPQPRIATMVLLVLERRAAGLGLELRLDPGRGGRRVWRAGLAEPERGRTSGGRRRADRGSRPHDRHEHPRRRPVGRHGDRSDRRR